MPDNEAPDALPPASTQYELLRDNGFKHLENPDLDDMHANEAFLRQRGQIGDNRAAENGIIEEVTCINFMCHERLHVVLGPLINFVVGVNGSGKSAVLTAVTLCLGGKASATNRGASMKSLIKEGRDQAILTVKLRNEGDGAYQPETYGDSVVVERYFSRNGSSGYRLKSSAGRTISHKKGDVDDVIEYFQLQVDNPMNVLTQDAAKSFIQSSTPAQKYKFFVEGVQLQQLDNDYKMISDTCDAIEAKLGDAEGNVKRLERETKAAEEKVKVVQQHTGMKREKRKLINQMAWAQVIEQEEQLAQCDTRIAQAQEKIIEAEAKVEEKDRLLQLSNQAIEHSQESIDELEQELVPLMEEEANARGVYDKATAALQAAHTDQRQIVESLKAARNNVANYEKDITVEAQRIEDANGGAHVRKLAEIEEAQNATEEAKAVLVRNDAERSDLDELRPKEEDAVTKAKDSLDRQQREIDDCHRRLRALDSDRGDDWAGYDPKVRTLCAMIQRDWTGGQKPVGPLGRHITLLKPRWSNMIEAVLGQHLSGFIVTSKAEQARLSSMMQKIRLEHCPILIGRNNHIDTTGHEPDPQFDTILRVLEIDNDVVRRQLVISHAIEQTILMPTLSEGARVMWSGPKPRNVRQCFVPHDSKRDFGLRLGYSGRNNDSEDTSPTRFDLRQKPRMKTDAESQIAIQRDVLDQLQGEKTTYSNNYSQAQQKLQQCEMAIKRNKRSFEQVKLNIQRAEERVEALQVELDQINPEDGKAEALKNHLAEAQNTVAMYEQNYQDSVNEKDELNKTSKESKRKLMAEKERVAEHEAKLEKSKTKLTNKNQARRMVLQEKNAVFEVIEQLRNEKARVEQKREAQATRTADFTAQATSVSPRVPVDEGETAHTLEAKIERISGQLKAYSRKLGGTDEEINNAFIEATKRYEDHKMHLDTQADLLALLKASFMQRVTHFQRFQRYIAAASRINFNYMLSERAFRGKLMIDHKAKLLDVYVEPDDTKKSGKGRATKTLSGGEKSFSSICLLLALWESMGAPLRCLDEYDVFMDDVNRDVSTRMIVSSVLVPCLIKC